MLGECETSGYAYGAGSSDPTGYYDPPTPILGGLAGGATYVPEGPVQPCRENRHIFRCKHEELCVCGRVKRLPYELSEGL